MKVRFKVCRVQTGAWYALAVTGKVNVVDAARFETPQEAITWCDQEAVKLTGNRLFNN
jgi:hypothetical protein